MFFFVAFLLINQIILFRFEKTFFTPAGIFTAIWLLTSIFYSSGYLDFYEPVDKLISILFLLFSSYYLGYYYLLFKYWKLIRINSVSFSNVKSSFKSLNLVTYFVFALLSLRTFSVFIDLLSEFGSIQNIFASGDIIYSKLRTNELNVGIATIIPSDMLACFFVSLRFLINRKIDWIFILALIETIIIAVLLSQRLSLIWSLIAMITPIASFARDIKIITIPRIIAILVFFFVSSTSRNLDMTYMVNKSNNLFMPLIAQFSSIGFYLAGPLAGLNEYIANGVDEYPLFFSLDGLLRNIQFIFNIEGLDSGSFSSVIYYTPFPTIVYTAFKFLIDDFGNFLYPILIAFGLFSVKIQTFNGSYLGFKCLLLTVVNATLGLSFFAYSFQIGGFVMFIFSCSVLLIIARSNIADILKK